MTTRRARRKKAIKLLVIRFLTITLIAGLTAIGIYQFDKFQCTRVIKPLYQLFCINDSIKYYKQQESLYQGFKDNTEYSNKIRELTQERRDNFYHSEDRVVAFITQKNSLIKFIILILAVVAIIFITIFPIIILLALYDMILQKFKRAWQRTNTIEYKGSIIKQ